MTINFNAGISVGFNPNQYPQTNGFRYSYSSAEFTFLGSINATIIVPVLTLDYEAKRERQKVHGTSVNPIGKTRGQIDYTCKCKMLLAEYQQMIDTLSAADPTGQFAFGDLMFDIKCTYAESIGGQPSIITDVIQGCSVDSVMHTTAFGPDALAVEMEFNPLLIIFNEDQMSSQIIQPPAV
jgi:hypothetical protein